jgi:hypothetical protein
MSKRNKFDIILPDGTKYKPPEKTMIIMNADGVVFLATNEGWDGWYIRLLSVTIPRYDVVMKT